MVHRDISQMTPIEFATYIDGKREARMSEIDRLSPQLRELVHEYGWYVVDQFLKQGISKPRIIRHLVETVLNEFSPTRGSSSKQGIARAPGLGDS